MLKAAPSKGTGSNAKYDWDTLLNGQTHQLRLGLDVTVPRTSFDAYARQVARGRGYSLSIKKLGDSLFLKATRKPNLADLPLEVET
jgi:hypothetical protein